MTSMRSCGTNSLRETMLGTALDTFKLTAYLRPCCPTWLSRPRFTSEAVPYGARATFSISKQDEFYVYQNTTLLLLLHTFDPSKHPRMPGIDLLVVVDGSTPAICLTGNTAHFGPAIILDAVNRVSHPPSDTSSPWHRLLHRA